MTVTQIKTQVIDADAHVVETEHTWDYMDPDERDFRPVLIGAKDDQRRQYWLIDGKIQGFRFPALSDDELRELSRRSDRDMSTSREARELVNASFRLRHMDQLGIDVQVLHNTLFIVQVTNRADVEAAICKSWNRWLADIWSEGGGRLRWSCVIPVLNVPEAMKQMKYSREHGACAVCFRPIEGNRLLWDPYFYPLYEAAQDLDLAIAVHIANGNPQMCDLLRSPYDPGSAFLLFRAPTATAVHGLILSRLPEKFPTLRFGFIEASSQWIPWIHKEAARRIKAQGREMPHDILKQYRIYVTCQDDDDVAYVVRYAGEDNLVTGTDYGHIDPSSEVNAMRMLSERTDIGDDVKRKILFDNPRALYAL